MYESLLESKGQQYEIKRDYKKLQQQILQTNGSRNVDAEIHVKYIQSISYILLT